jgi:hypothetical protein
MAFKIPPSKKIVKPAIMDRFIQRIANRNPELAKNVAIGSTIGVIGITGGVVVSGGVLFAEGLLTGNPLISLLALGGTGGVLYLEKKVTDKLLNKHNSYKYPPTKNYPKGVTIVARNKAEADRTYLLHIKR